MDRFYVTTSKDYDEIGDEGQITIIDEWNYLPPLRMDEWDSDHGRVSRMQYALFLVDHLNLTQFDIAKKE